MRTVMWIVFVMFLAINAVVFSRSASSAPTPGFSPCGVTQSFTVSAGNSTLVPNDGGSNRIYLCSGLFNTPSASSFGLLEGPPANNCASDGGPNSVVTPLVCGLSNDGGTCYFNSGGGYEASASMGVAITTQRPGDSLCISTDGGVTGSFAAAYAP